jgi:hypothetical protein
LIVIIFSIFLESKHNSHSRSNFRIQFTSITNRTCHLASRHTSQEQIPDC